MSNQLNEAVFVLDTPGTIIASSVHIRITGIRWVGCTAAGHQAIVTDGQAREVWASKSPIINFVDADSPTIKDFYGLIVPTLDSGKLYLELGQ